MKARVANRLAGERSLYLRQHATNPVDWHPWGDEALALARAEDKPIFLSVGYASCHWCHVMEREVFEDDDVAGELNEHWVAIKVDREERPDLDAAYMDALQAMTGSGGWPMSLFLTPDQKPFYAATYLPKGQFLAATARLAALYRDRADEVRRVALQVAARLAEPSSLPEAEPFTVDDAARLLRQMSAHVDGTWGGLGGAMKFPSVPRWRAALRVAARVGDRAALDQVRLTLDSMASGGLWDHLGGGFHRYAVDRAWTVPHFEKMLYDQALLALLYLDGFEVLGDARYAEVARATLEFLANDLQEQGGGFGASYDADSGGAEGSYYTWTPAELIEAAGPEDGKALALLLGVGAHGQVDGRSVLGRRVPVEQAARALAREPRELEGMFERERPGLLELRSRRTPPVRDRKLVTSWNGLAIQALARGGASLAEPSFVEAAVRAAERLQVSNRWPDGRLAAASNEGVPVGPGGLDEYAAQSLGWFELYRATGERRWLDGALSWVDEVRAGFARAEGGFWSTRVEEAGPLGPRFEVFDHALPSGNGLLAGLLVDLAASAARPDLALDAVRFLRSQASLLRAAGFEMGSSVEAALRLDAPNCGPDGCSI
jgi:uncharacterized protein YyaL (SSP411 family)